MMKKNICFFTLITMLFLSVTTVFAVSINTEQDAKIIAMRYAQKFNWTYGSPTIAKLRYSFGHGNLWEVEFSDSGIVRIYKYSSETQSVSDWAKKKLLGNGESVEVTIDEQTALEAAKRYIKIFNISDAIEFMNITQAYNKEWEIRWKRVLDGVPYQSGGVCIDISPIDGTFLGYACDFTELVPRETSVYVTPEDAITCGRDIAGQIGAVSIATGAANAELKIVRPDNYWTGGQELITQEQWEKYRNTPTRVAWVVQLRNGEDMEEFWIDAGNGVLVGGAQTESHGFTTKHLSKKFISSHHAKVQKQPIRKLQKPSHPAK
jgi:hypothetical protein